MTATGGSALGRWTAPLSLVGVAGVPLATVALLPYSARTGPPAIWQCPLLHLTGVPCPACGATRAFVYLLHGDGRALHYNWSWVLWWVLACALLAWVVLRRARGHPGVGGLLGAVGGRMRASPAWVAGVTLGLLALSWALALVNLRWIRAG